MTQVRSVPGAQRRQAVGEVLVVGQVALVLQQVVGAPVERLALPGRQVTLGGTAADAGSHPARATLQHAPEALQHPLFQFFAALDRHRVARLPQVSEHMKEVEHDGQLHPVVRGQFCEEVQLRLVAVDHGNPGPGTLPVATDGFAERLLQDLPWPLLQARPHPLVPRTGTRRGLLLSFLRPRQHGEHLLGVRTWRATE